MDVIALLGEHYMLKLKIYQLKVVLEQMTLKSISGMSRTLLKLTNWLTNLWLVSNGLRFLSALPFSMQPSTDILKSEITI